VLCGDRDGRARAGGTDPATKAGRRVAALAPMARESSPKCPDRWPRNPFSFTVAPTLEHMGAGPTSLSLELCKVNVLTNRIHTVLRGATATPTRPNGLKIRRNDSHTTPYPARTTWYMSLGTTSKAMCWVPRTAVS